jgi:hypothetical protein
LGGLRKKPFDFRKLQFKNVFDKTSSYKSNIILHKFPLCPMFRSWDLVYPKILVTPLVQRTVDDHFENSFSPNFEAKAYVYPLDLKQKIILFLAYTRKYTSSVDWDDPIGLWTVLLPCGQTCKHTNTHSILGLRP